MINKKNYKSMNIRKDMKRVVYLFVLCIFLMSFCCAAPELFFKTGNNIEYKRPCFNNGTYCSAVTQCNLTVLSQNSSVILDNKAMTNKVAYHNYTINGTGLVSGDYIVIMSCTDGALSGSEVITIQLNPTGFEPTEMRTSTNSRAVYIIFGISILLFIGFLFLQQDSVKWTLFILSIIFLVTSLNLILVNLKNEITDVNVIELFDFISAASFYFYWLAGGLIFIIWVLTFFNTMNESFAKRKYAKYGAEF